MEGFDDRDPDERRRRRIGGYIGFVVGAILAAIVLEFVQSISLDPRHEAIKPGTVLFWLAVGAVIGWLAGRRAAR